MHIFKCMLSFFFFFEYLEVQNVFSGLTLSITALYPQRLQKYYWMWIVIEHKRQGGNSFTGYHMVYAGYFFALRSNKFPFILIPKAPQNVHPDN